ncbi:hypothetical protein P8452_17036 [Trifolium repens]|nr:hypothetical protein P8452_17036 [Trifolium repens]
MNDWFVALVSPVEKILLFISGSGREFSCGFCLQVLSFYEGNSASYELYRKLNISIIKNGVIHKVSWVKYRQHVLNSTAAIADVILIREESLKELSLIVNGVVMSYITTQAAAETLILSTGGLKKTFL